MGNAKHGTLLSNFADADLSAFAPNVAVYAWILRVSKATKVCWAMPAAPYTRKLYIRNFLPFLVKPGSKQINKTTCLNRQVAFYTSYKIIYLCNTKSGSFK